MKRVVVVLAVLMFLLSGNASAGTTERVSVSSSGNQGNGNSYDAPAISADGRYVAFASDAPNLADPSGFGYRNLFVRDKQLGTTERIGSEWSTYAFPSISADGRYVSFP